jgi:hypothetical protein
MDISEIEADWRLAKVARVAGDQVLPGGTPVKDGTVLWQVTVTKDAQHGRVNFPTPSPAALALSISIAAAHSAGAHRNRVRYSARMVDGSLSTESADVSPLFAYFEQCMVAVTFAYQSLEAYSNQVISHAVKEQFALRRGKQTLLLAAEELERTASTEEKLSLVLPALMGVDSLKGKKLWQRFKTLKSVRDATIHLKSQDHYVRGRLDRESLYYRFLNGSAVEYPRIAVLLIRHFCAASPERWISFAEDRLAEPGPAA